MTHEIEFHELLESYNKINIIMHHSPDGDAIGSASALYQVLNKQNKQVDIYCVDFEVGVFEYLKLPDVKSIITIDKDSLYIILDCGDLRRTGYAEEIKKISKITTIINIDHHPRNNLHSIARCNIFDDSISSTCEIFYNLFETLNIKINNSIATSLLVGIYTDTGGFIHSNISPATLKIISKLLELGANLKKVTNSLVKNRSDATLKIWGNILSNIHYSEIYKTAYSVVKVNDNVDNDVDRNSFSGLVNIINSIPNTRIAMLLINSKGIIKGSFRTENKNIDLSKLASYFNGGGHKKASGFMVQGNILKAKNNYRVEVNSIRV